LKQCTIFCKQRRSEKKGWGDKWEHTVLSAGFGGVSTHFAIIEKHVLKQTFTPKYAKKQRVISRTTLQKKIVLVRTSFDSASTHFTFI